MKKTKARKDGTRTYRVLYALLAGLFRRIILRVHVVNPQNEPTEGGVLVCANHIGASDPIVLATAFRQRQIFFMAKKELFRVPLLGWLIRVLAFPVDRSGGDVGAIKRAVAHLQGGRCMGIFPQGHRHPGVDPRETPVKKGAALIDARAKADVLPVYIHRKGNKPRIFRKTYVVIGERIPYTEIEAMGTSSADYQKISEMIFDRICMLGEDFKKEMGDTLK